MNVIMVTKPDVQQWNIILDSVATIPKYKKITIDHDIYINFFTDVTVYYLRVSNDDVLNTTNNEAAFN